ncbi:hypothetical protein KSP40_PGU016563 [Platanthera guangdongensis]|uniref:Uncharacterized protein n=1 Tax=Platanthera guangdongensis TaxID=2320717 RepID=A0ABR2MDP4_9ASPA
MNSKGRSIGDRLIRCIWAPIRGLARACDYYVHSMTTLADRFPAEAAATTYFSFAGDDALRFSSAMRSSGEDDLFELVRFASQCRVAAAAEAVRRSRSAALGRIDENEICDFSGEVGESLIFPGRRGFAVGRKRDAAVFPA